MVANLMHNEHPIIVPSEELGLAVVWHGGVTFNVHEWTETYLAETYDGHVIAPVLGDEVDVFTVYGNDDTGTPPTTALAYQEIVDWFEAQEAAMQDEAEGA